jgi:hypothetical protein
MEMIQAHPEKPWNWNRISANPNVTMEMIQAHPEKPWDWDFISDNPNLTMEMIQAHPEKPWNWNRISYNPNLTMEIIESYIERINFVYLSENRFGWKKDDTLKYYKERKEQTIKQTLEIKEELLAISMHPDRVLDWCFSNEERDELASSWC